jgi:hypothetical protein
LRTWRCQPIGALLGGSSAEAMVWAVLCDVSENDRQWRLADLGFGFVLHAGDSIDDVGFNGSGAAVRYDTMVGMDHGLEIYLPYVTGQLQPEP